MIMVNGGYKEKLDVNTAANIRGTVVYKSAYEIQNGIQKPINK